MDTDIEQQRQPAPAWHIDANGTFAHGSYAGFVFMARVTIVMEMQTCQRPACEPRSRAKQSTPLQGRAGISILFLRLSPPPPPPSEHWIEMRQ